ncbi:DUF4082 domain-containing protein [Leifsonia sp. YAF41]|uniref:DUF4082 domain-containing protein n=1 Tax=Leifsonia sp. YAF41 TaxID=3233086 RepID=UPI003F9843B3
MTHAPDADNVSTTSGASFRRRHLAAFLAIVLVLVLAATAGLWFLGTATAAPDTIMGSDAPTKLAQNSDSSGVEVGTRFSVLANGTATGMRFWKVSAAPGVHEGTLWTAQGKELAKANFTAETSSGWQSAEFDNEIALQAGQTYVVSYYAAAGRYAVTEEYSGTSLSPDLEISPGFGLFTYGSSTRFPTDTYRNSSYWVDVVFTPDSPLDQRKNGTASTRPAAPPTPTPTPVQPTLVEGFPSADTTGVPTGTALSPYTGPCRITTAGTVIDAKTVNCTLQVEAQGVVITRSVINGTVFTEEDGVGSFAISDSDVVTGGEMGTGIGDARFTATRVEVTGGNRSVNCSLDCTIADSYLHGQFRDAEGKAHESGIRMGSGSVISGNTIACDAPDVAPDAGCSAALTGYGDFAVVKNNTIDGNLIVGNSGGYCTFGGSTPGKPFSTGTRDIRFTNNVWQRGASGKCGAYGPITSFDSNAPGNVWANNSWEDGTPVQAAN